MKLPMTRRTALKALAAQCVATMPTLTSTADARPADSGVVSGRMTGARALVETLLAEGTGCVFGIPGAQENELWDEMKSRQLPYLLVTHEFSAACMADGYARSTGRPGVISIVPGPGVTNALSGIGEALLDSVPLVCIVGDVARGDKYKPFQVHELPASPASSVWCPRVCLRSPAPRRFPARCVRRFVSPSSRSRGRSQSWCRTTC